MSIPASATLLAQTAQTAVPPPVADPVAANAGGLVFLFVSAVIVGGALVLYLRHRRPRTKTSP